MNKIKIKADNNQITYLESPIEMDSELSVKPASKSGAIRTKKNKVNSEDLSEREVGIYKRTTLRSYGYESDEKSDDEGDESEDDEDGSDEDDEDNEEKPEKKKTISFVRTGPVKSKKQGKKN